VTIADEDIIIDSCTLANFAAVESLSILQKQFGGRGHWTYAIQHEARRLDVPDTGWLDPPIDVSANGVIAIIRVQEIREELGATSSDPATLHLGEAEAIYYIESHNSSWTFISDDRPAVDFAEKRGLNAALSEEVLAYCYEHGNIGCPDAFNLLVRTESVGRGVRVPPNHWFVCPPRTDRADS
jgi:predicted nucleic acid-binding protein